MTVKILDGSFYENFLRGKTTIYILKTMLTSKFFRLPIYFALFALAFSVSAQTKNRRPEKKTTAKTAEVETRKDPETKPEETAPIAGKKNSRPGDKNSDGAGVEQNKANTDAKLAFLTYEFEQPQFVISRIRIEHDENGKGKITFKKRDFEEEVNDPIKLTDATLEKIKTHLEALNFLDSTESYQHENDYSHLGTMKITMRKNDKQRTAGFNWTDNKDAKAIADEYRKISNQYIWMFDISVARENQPLEAPRLMKSLDNYLKRGEISDPSQMIPFLKDLSDDERIPLIARNNASRIIKEIEKKKKE